MKNICFKADKTVKAQEALEKLVQRYGSVSSAKADVFVVLGGDGFMLKMLHRYMSKNIPFYGMNQGRVGFLMNDFQIDNLLENLDFADKATLRPLAMEAFSTNGNHKKALAFNEVSLLRQSRQSANIAIRVDGKKKLENLVCDGVLVSTPAGSTAYNFSVHGPILPLTSNVLALTPISPFRPRRWKGAILPHNAEVCFEILDDEKRPVSAVADFTEIRNVTKVTVKEEPNVALTLLFNKEANLEERVLNEQFME